MRWRKAVPRPTRPNDFHPAAHQDTSQHRLKPCGFGHMFYKVVNQRARTMGEKLILGSFELATVTALLRLKDNAYGVKIRQELEALLKKTVAIGAVYTTLARLEGKGFVSSYTGDPTPERGGRAK